MSKTRPTRSKSDSSVLLKQKAPIKNKTEQNKWIFIVPDSILSSSRTESSGSSTENVSLCTLRHPRTETGVMFLMTNGSTRRVFEVNKSQQKYGSCLVGSNMHSDNSMYITTPMDPMFLILPYLINAGKGNQFMCLDQIVCDEEFPDCRKLLSCDYVNQIGQVADCTEIDDDFKVYRYNKDKTLEWLKQKTQNTASKLESKKINVSSNSSSSSIFVRSKNEKISTENYTEYACGLISDYLPHALVQDLKDFLGIVDSKVTAENGETENEPPHKKARLGTEGSTTPLEDYSQFGLKKETSKTSKLTAAQKRLSKVDKSGMKSISSFFSPKS